MLRRLVRLDRWCLLRLEMGQTGSCLEFNCFKDALRCIRSLTSQLKQSDVEKWERTFSRNVEYSWTPKARLGTKCWIKTSARSKTKLRMRRVCVYAFPCCCFGVLLLLTAWACNASAALAGCQCQSSCPCSCFLLPRIVFNGSKSGVQAQEETAGSAVYQCS